MEFVYERSGRFITRRGITIIEVLITMAIVFGVLALVSGFTKSSRAMARGVLSQTNARSMFIGLSQYAAESKDLPPVLGPIDHPEGKPWRFEFGTLGNGNWFDHTFMYAAAITSYLESPEVGVAPGNPKPPKVFSYHGVRAALSDYQLTDTAYASGSYFNFDSMIGRSQFGGQRLASVAFPAAKGALWQPIIFHHSTGNPVTACCSFGVESPVAFFDGSASQHVMRDMRPGVVNLLGNTRILPSIDPRTIPGTPVATTINGFGGRDL